MRRFFKNTKGAVTVFVTLLLIPAILITGTAVDIARMYTARSTVQNANQLAANAVLSQYDALLNDIYGLFGIMQTNPTLGDMLVDYISISVFGDDTQDRSLGTLQPFYGSNLQPPNVAFAPNQNLGNPDVLRRQINDYIKYRAPFIILEDINILKIIESLTKLVADSTAIRTKNNIDRQIQTLLDRYETVFNRIREVNGFARTAESAFNEINSYLELILDQFSELGRIRNSYTAAYDLPDEDEDRDDILNQLTIEHNEALGEIRRLAIGLDNLASSLNRSLNDYERALNRLVTASANADSTRRNVLTYVNRLDNQLGSASQALRNGLTTRPHGEPYSIMEQYRNLVAQFGESLVVMAVALQNDTLPRIEQARGVLDNIGFGNVSGNTISAPMMTTSDLRALRANNTFPIDFEIETRGMAVENRPPDRLAIMGGIFTFKYSFNFGFRTYSEMRYDHSNFYSTLVYIFENPDRGQGEGIRSNVLTMLRYAMRAFRNIASLTPEGEQRYPVSADSNDNQENPFGDNWDSETGVRDGTRDALNPSGGFMSGLAGIAREAGDRFLLATYGTQMFSNFATCSGGKDTTLSGVPLSTDVNFFFQSEQEYLFNGNLQSARRNIAAVAGWILMVRFVFNYISTFVIREIKIAIAKLWKIPIFGLAIGEIARLGWALAESVVDIVALLSGQGVPLLKLTWDQWHLGGGAVSFAGETIANILELEHITTTAKAFKGDIEYASIGGVISVGPEGIKIELEYRHYLFLMLLTRPSEVLASRMGHLISLNVTHFPSSPRYANVNYLRGAHTGFTITTTVDMRMLFLGLPVAQNFADGRGMTLPSNTLTMTATDIRGY